MAKLRFRIAMSLDGYAAGPEQSKKNPLGIGGAGESASDSARALAAEAETGRRRAIEHYGQALAGIRDPGLRRSIWSKAVRLMLRRPIETRYFCEYD